MAVRKQTALITGGASGMGLAVAKELSKKGWNVAIVDLNKNQDVTRYEKQLAAFQEVQEVFGSIDFVFANAGVIGKADFYDPIDDWPPKPPSLAVQHICLTGVIYTCHLAMHYMRRNQTPGGAVVITASAASLYATPDLPLYTSSKHAVLGLMRSLSLKLIGEGIRVNCILPGAIRTALHSEQAWSQFDQHDFTPIEEIVGTVVELVEDPKANGMALEVSRGEIFDRKQPEFCNSTMQKILTASKY